jgi:methylase of polypeptide subunit release factors
MSESALEAGPVETVQASLARVGYTTERLEQALGGGRVSFGPADLAVHERRLAAGDPFSVLVRLFLLGSTVPAVDVEAALAALKAEVLARDGWLESGDGGIRATAKLVPHGDLLIASDRDSGGPSSDSEWVPGIHPPSVTLAKLTVRRPVASALDVGTGNGIQALLAARHAEAVVATDVNPRALVFAALNADLNALSNIEFRRGSYFEPVAGERFDLITCNPPYVISPERRYAYRDGGLTGDSVSRQVVNEAAELLNEGGFAHVLINWAHPPGDRWSTLERWVDGAGCDSWLLHFGSDDPVTYAAAWLRPVARDDPERFRDHLAVWLDYFTGLGIEAIAHGAIILRRRSGGRNWTRRDSVPLDRLEQSSEHLLRVFDAQDYLESLDDDRQLLESTFALAERHHLEQTLACRGGRAELQATVISLDEGLGFRTGIDLHTAELVPLLDGHRPLAEALALRASAMGLEGEQSFRFESAAIPVVRRLLQLGVLERRDLRASRI